VRPAAAGVLVAVLAAGCGGSPQHRRVPILFVHGLGGTPKVWTTMVARLRAAGW
jgi:triacylglycerol esterase/lipase EstA (alpha/beta hydrolase family)